MRGTVALDLGKNESIQAKPKKRRDQLSALLTNSALKPDCRSAIVFLIKHTRLFRYRDCKCCIDA